MDPQIKHVIDRTSVVECIAALARGEDRRDAALISACWWPDATYDYGVQNGSFPEYLAWVVPGAEAIKNTQHVLGQSHVVLTGTQAKAETHVVSYHRVDMGSGDQDTCVGGRYLDTLEERNGKWRIASRTMLYDWYTEWGNAVDWAKGVMGIPFTAPHYAGRAQDDHSETFFDQV